MVKVIKAKPLKTFTSFIKDEEESIEQDGDQETLEESNLISKGYALGQSGRHETTKRQLESISNQIEAICNRAKREADLEDKIDTLIDAVSKFAGALKLQAELSKNNINVAVATNLLEDDIKSLLKKK